MRGKRIFCEVRLVITHVDSGDDSNAARVCDGRGKTGTRNANAHSALNNRNLRH
ncbi:hypothetical protein SDC9_147085 [bioreactor metagenome]|uniref:Uncharacterized protein n=1 Tax=bioreactor metagenome TaxID=1076179 RepID=A0A645EDF2_9ZZZZ